MAYAAIQQHPKNIGAAVNKLLEHPDQVTPVPKPKVSLMKKGKKAKTDSRSIAANSASTQRVRPSKTTMGMYLQIMKKDSDPPIVFLDLRKEYMIHECMPKSIKSKYIHIRN